MGKKKLIYFLIVVLFLLSLVGLLIGSVAIPLQYLFKSEIFWQIRVPRVILSICVGMALGISGVVLQGVLRNPLADPYILGVSSGASIGAALAIGLGIKALIFGGNFVTPIAFLFSLGAVFLVYRISFIRNKTSPETLILAGVSVSSFASAILAIIIIVSGHLQSIYFWLLGSLSMASYADIFNLLPYILVGGIISYFYSKELNALLLGEEMAYTLGVDVEKTRFIMIIVATLMTSAAVSVSGLIGFIGIIVPHFVRMLISSNYRVLVPASALCGAILVLAADILGRTVLSPVEIPIGVVMALIGGPFFLYVLRKRSLFKR